MVRRNAWRSLFRNCFRCDGLIEMIRVHFLLGEAPLRAERDSRNSQH